VSRRALLRPSADPVRRGLHLRDRPTLLRTDWLWWIAGRRVREPTTERRLDRPDTADEAFLHQRHREADSGLVELFRAVVNILDVVGDRSVELALLVGHLDRDGSDITVREDALAVVVIDSLLAAAHHHAVDCFLREVLVFGDEERVDVLDERPERFALAVVWRRAEQEQRIGVVSHSFDHLRRFARGLAALGCLIVPRRRPRRPRTRRRVPRGILPGGGTPCS